jgi:hypothetical protein
MWMVDHEVCELRFDLVDGCKLHEGAMVSSQRDRLWSCRDVTLLQTRTATNINEQ